VRSEGSVDGEGVLVGLGYVNITNDLIYPTYFDLSITCDGVVFPEIIHPVGSEYISYHSPNDPVGFISLNRFQEFDAEYTRFLIEPLGLIWGKEWTYWRIFCQFEMIDGMPHGWCVDEGYIVNGYILGQDNTYEYNTRTSPASWTMILYTDQGGGTTV
jgi:hypothetical protein